jgi:hypothetical protein
MAIYVQCRKRAFHVLPPIESKLLSGLKTGIYSLYTASGSYLVESLTLKLLDQWFSRFTSLNMTAVNECDIVDAEINR